MQMLYYEIFENKGSNTFHGYLRNIIQSRVDSTQPCTLQNLPYLIIRLT